MESPASLDRVALPLAASAEALVELRLGVCRRLLGLVLLFLLRGGVRLLLTRPPSDAARGRADRGALPGISSNRADRGAHGRPPRRPSDRASLLGLLRLLLG